MKKILYILAITSSLFASGCWNTQELANMADRELDDVVVFSFKDAVTCEPVRSANITLLGKNYTTNYKGQIEVPLPPEDMNRYVHLKFKRDGYITLNQDILASSESFWNTKFLVSKDLSIHSMRFVLSWDKRPRDLDLHLVSNNFHISYRNTKSIANKVQLDRDARQGYGAETITLDRVNKNKLYKLYVYNYSNETPFSGKANVAIYKNNLLNRVVPIDNNSRCVEVAEIYDNQVNYTMKSVADSYCQ